MNLLDVFGDGRYLINLDLVRQIRIEGPSGDPGKKDEIKFVYGNGEESIFGVSSARLTVIYDILYDYKVSAA
jgi:hypothetical protein